MDKRLGNVKTEKELKDFLLEQSMETEPLDNESKQYVMKLCNKLNLSKSILRVHYDIQKKKSETTSQ